MKKLILIATAISGIAMGGAAFGSDHLFNATTAPGSQQRGFGNPVVANPGDSRASPATVPGEGNPNAGQDRGTPSINPDFLQCEAQEHVPFDPEGC
jgi:hypothetical protein